MAMRRSHTAVLVLAAVALLAPGCKTERIRDIESRVPVGLTAAQVGNAVVAGASRRQWIVVENAPGRAVARIDVRARHMAEVEITYDERSYRIAYHDSENLKAHSGRIHQNYLRWIAKLDQAIRAELVRASSSARPAEAAKP